MSYIYLIRHGQAGSRDNYDVLSEPGQQQARSLGEHLLSQGVEFSTLIAGGMQRQLETARIAREALAAFESTQRAAITRAFELSLKNDNPRQRELAARELTNYGGPNSPGLLVPLLDDQDAGVRCAAVVTLGKLKDPRTLDVILGRAKLLVKAVQNERCIDAARIEA